MLRGVHHLTLRVEDLQRSRAFYEGTLGLFCDQAFGPGESDSSPHGKLRFRLGESTRLALVPASPSDPLSLGVDHVALHVDEAEELHELASRLELAGIETQGVQAVSGGGELVAFCDPDGIRLEFFHQAAMRACRLAAFVLPIQDGRVLLARMNYGPRLWAMAGGMIEPGEEIDEAARREVLEETGLNVTTDQLIAVGDRGGLVLFVFVGKVLGGDLAAQEDEISELRWFDADELEALGADAFDLAASLGVEQLRESPLAGFGIARSGLPDGSSFPVFAARHTA